MNRILVSILFLIFCCAAPALAQDAPAQGEAQCFTLTDRDGVAIQLTELEDSIYKAGRILLVIASGEVKVDVAKIRSLEFGDYEEQHSIPGNLVLLDGTAVPVQGPGYLSWSFTTPFGQGEVKVVNVLSLVRCP